MEGGYKSTIKKRSFFCEAFFGVYAQHSCRKSCRRELWSPWAGDGNGDNVHAPKVVVMWVNNKLLEHTID